MDDNKELITNLILAVCQLCDETRELARADTNSGPSLTSVEDAAHMVALAIGRIQASGGVLAYPPALPSQAVDEATADNWLLGDD